MCDYSANRIEQLKLHSLRHDEISIKCSYCELKFISNVSLNIHMKHSHGGNGGSKDETNSDEKHTKIKSCEKNADKNEISTKNDETFSKTNEIVKKNAKINEISSISDKNLTENQEKSKRTLRSDKLSTSNEVLDKNADKCSILNESHGKSTKNMKNSETYDKNAQTDNKSLKNHEISSKTPPEKRRKLSPRKRHTTGSFETSNSKLPLFESKVNNKTSIQSEKKYEDAKFGCGKCRLAFEDNTLLWEHLLAERELNLIIFL